MGPFIVPRAQKKPYLPVLTMEEISNVLVLYLSTITEYIHSTADIECNPAAKTTALALQGQVDPKLGRRVRVCATIRGRTAANFNTKLWADPFAVRIESEDLDLKLDLAVEPHADRTITVSKVRGFGDVRTVNPPAENSTATSVSPDVDEGVVETSAAGLSMANPDAIAGNDDQSVESQGATIAAFEAGPSASETGELQVETAPVLEESPVGRQLADDAAVDESIENSEAISGDSSHAVELRANMIPASETFADDGEVIAENPAEVSIEIPDMAVGEDNKAAEPQADTDAALEALRGAVGIVAEAPVFVTFENMDAASGAEIQAVESQAATIAALEVSLGESAVIMAPAGETSTENAEAIAGGTPAAESLSDTISNSEAMSSDAETMASRETIEREDEAVTKTHADKPITISEVLSSEEELVVELHAQRPVSVTDDKSCNDKEVGGDEKEDADREPPTRTATTTDDDLIYSEDGQAVFDREDPAANATANGNGRIDSEDGQAVFDGAQAVDGGHPTEPEHALAVGENERSSSCEIEESDDPINSVSEQVVAGPGQKTRCAIIKGDGEFDFSIVGESHYQRELEQITGGYAALGTRRLVAALLVPEPTNFFDKYAVAVQIEKCTVGYLTFGAGPVFLKTLAGGGFDCAACAAAIVGGEDRGDGSFAEFRVKLDAVLPFVLMEGGPPSTTAGELQESPATARAA